MIYFVERADGRVKLGFLRSLYGIELQFQDGKLIALVEGSTHRLGAIRTLFASIPQQDGWYLMTSGMAQFIQQHAIANSPDPHLRDQWERIVHRNAIAIIAPDIANLPMKLLVGSELRETYLDDDD